MTTAQQTTAIIAEQNYRGATIRTQLNGYLNVVINGQRKGGFVSLEEAQAYIFNTGRQTA